MNRRNMNLRTDGFVRNIYSRNAFDVNLPDCCQRPRACGAG